MQEHSFEARVYIEHNKERLRVYSKSQLYIREIYFHFQEADPAEEISTGIPQEQVLPEAASLQLPPSNIEVPTAGDLPQPAGAISEPSAALAEAEAHLPMPQGITPITSAPLGQNLIEVEQVLKPVLASLV